MKINIHRVLAMIIRYFTIFFHSYDRLSDMFYWPVIDLFIWGFTGLYFVRQAKNPGAIFVLLTGLVFWIVIWRSSYEVSINLLEEIWDKNIVNIFASPLKLSEWIVSLIFVGFLKSCINLVFSALVALLLYKFNFLFYGFWILPFTLSLLMTGWAAGFTLSAFIIRYGQKIQTVAWNGIGLIAPFSAAFYSLASLPEWAQKIGLFLPSTYIFESMRDLLFKGSIDPAKIITAFALNILYLILSIWFFVFMFHKSRKMGLGRLI